jgi:hypothetical protein
VIVGDLLGIEKIRKKIENNVNNQRVPILGAAFKNNGF